MSALFPEIEREVRAAARVASKPRRVTMSLRAVALAVTSLMFVGGVAYAARGLWAPSLGGGRAESSAVPADQRDALELLRRPQSDGDRDAAAEYALKFTPAGTGVRLLSVRRTEASGQPPVVVTSQMDRDGADSLCLWLEDSEGGGRTCGTTDDLRSGRLVVTFGQVRGRSGEYLLPKKLNAPREPAESTTYAAAGLAPDGVNYAHISGDGVDLVVPVRSNVFRFALNELPAKPLTLSWQKQ